MRILLIGRGPPLQPDAEADGFPTYRTWHFLRALLRAGHDVFLVALEPQGQAGWKTFRTDGRLYRCLRESEIDADGADRPLRWLDDTQADVVISAGPYLPAKCAAAMPAGPRVVIDLPGDPIAEAQMKAFASGDNTPIALSARVLAGALARADRFTVIGRRQHYALLGELAFMGRMHKETVGIDPVLEVPIAIEARWMDRPRGRMWNLPPGRREGPRTDRVLWPGSLNTWADIDTFVEACEFARNRHPGLEIVLTGGAIRGLTEQRYARLEERIDQSPHRAGFFLRGKIPEATLDHLLRTSAVGVSLDLDCLEAVLGSRTRLLHGLVCGLPWIVTPGPELADELIAHGLATAVPHGQPEAVGETILETLERERMDGGMASRNEGARQAILRAHSLDRVSAGLVRYLEDPRPLAPPHDVHQRLIERLQTAERRLAAIHHSITWRVLSRIHRRLIRNSD